jgi:hypothetical protein
MLDIDIEDNLTKNQNSYDGLISTIEVGQGTLVLILASCTARTFQAELIGTQSPAGIRKFSRSTPRTPSFKG